MYSSNPTFIWLKMDEDCEIADLHGSVDSNEARSRYASIKRTHWQSGIVGDNSILVEALQQTPRCEAELKIVYDFAVLYPEQKPFVHGCACANK